MAKILYIGGSGEISYACVEASVRAGHDVTVFNRGRRSAIPDGAMQVTGDFADDNQYAALASEQFDVVCQFIVFSPEQLQRDIRIFKGHCGQYVFVSSASAYQKPCPVQVITESLPLDNPFWEYSRLKAACEQALQVTTGLPFTIVRPSHTYRTRLPGSCTDGDHMVWRMRQGKPIIIHDQGESLWTLTHAEDFARAFVDLLGNTAALGEAFHITRDDAYTWNDIIRAVANAMGCRPDIRHVSTDMLIAFQPDWLGPLLGDKSNSVRFDNTRVRTVIGHWRCEIGLATGLERAAVFAEKRLSANYAPEAATDALLDQIVSEI